MIKPFSQFRTENPLEAIGYKEFAFSIIGNDEGVLSFRIDNNTTGRELSVAQGGEGQENQVIITGLGLDERLSFVSSRYFVDLADQLIVCAYYSTLATPVVIYFYDPEFNTVVPNTNIESSLPFIFRIATD
jgi:hypothetical protein